MVNKLHIYGVAIMTFFAIACFTTQFGENFYTRKVKENKIEEFTKIDKLSFSFKTVRDRIARFLPGLSSYEVDDIEMYDTSESNEINLDGDENNNDNTNDTNDNSNNGENNVDVIDTDDNDNNDNNVDNTNDVNDDSDNNDIDNGTGNDDNNKTTSGLDNNNGTNGNGNETTDPKNEQKGIFEIFFKETLPYCWNTIVETGIGIKNWATKTLREFGDNVVVGFSTLKRNTSDWCVDNLEPRVNKTIDTLKNKTLDGLDFLEKHSTTIVDWSRKKIELISHMISNVMEKIWNEIRRIYMYYFEKVINCKYLQPIDKICGKYCIIAIFVTPISFILAFILGHTLVPFILWIIRVIIRKINENDGDNNDNDNENDDNNDNDNENNEGDEAKDD